MLKVLKAIWDGFVTLLSLIKAAIVGTVKIATWPARWAYAKAAASSIGLRIWAWSIDPPAIRGIWIVILFVALPVIGIATDRYWIRGDDTLRIMGLESRLMSVGQANLACLGEKNAWESRALDAEDKYANMMKKEPLPEVTVAPLAKPAEAKKAPARRKKKVDKPWYEKL
jgi:hypothetical protein